MSFERIKTLNLLTHELEVRASALAMLALHSTHPSRVRQAARNYLETLELKNRLEFTGEDL